MTHETLHCAEGINPERLAALRHGALSAAAAERLRAHVADCAACQARMAELEAALGALRAEPELDPGDRVIAGVRARLAGQPGRARGGRLIWNMSGGRRVWAGLAALAPVAALILLFVYVFAGIGRQPQSAATPTITATATATPFGQKPIYPTATPMTVQLPTYTPAVSASAAWGTFTPMMSHTFAPNGSVEFIPQAYSSDLATIGGVVFNTSNFGTGAQAAQLAYYTVATGAITKLSPTWRGYGGPWGGMSSLDNRYIVYGFNSQPGATCGLCNNTLWSYDRVTGKTWKIDPGPTASGVPGSLYSGDQMDIESADHVAFLPMQDQVWVADLAAHKLTLTLPTGAQPASASSSPGPQERLLGFQWPYLIYTESPAVTTPTITLNILDLATGFKTLVAETASVQSDNPVSNSMNMALVGKTLYAVTQTQLNGVDDRGRPVNLTYGTLYRLDNAFAPGGTFTTLATWPVTDTGVASSFAASSRLIWLGSGYFWDLAESRLVTTSLTDVQLVGRYIVAMDGQPQGNPVQTYRIAAYDTSTFAIRQGG